MAAILTAKEFLKYVNTNFSAKLDAEAQTDLELTEVKTYSSQQEEQSGMERFSVFFTGPLEPHLPQGLYKLEHDQMGEFDIFLVPVERNEHGFRYEAVFNYFKSTEE